MFSGIIEELGVFSNQESFRYQFKSPTVLEDANLGDSIAVNGCCLTISGIKGDSWFADLSEETLNRTNLGQLQPGDLVNLERPVRVGDRLGGHIVQGHVDGVGEVIQEAPDLEIAIPNDLISYVVDKGSVAVDGCSLTAINVTDLGFGAAIVPHTAANTTLGNKKAGERVNIEVDVLAKYVERLSQRSS